MARKVFYSFHYKRDSQRAAQVRNSHVIANSDQYGVIDSVEWEKIEREGEEAIKRWINEQLKYTSVTAILIGAETANREWVQYEIERSWERGNGLVGVRIHNVKDLDGKTDSAGRNPLDEIYLKDGTPLSKLCKTYDWCNDKGIENLGSWAEEAFQFRANYKGEVGLKSGTQQTNYRPTPHVITAPAKPWLQ